MPSEGSQGAGQQEEGESVQLPSLEEAGRLVDSSGLWWSQGRRWERSCRLGLSVCQLRSFRPLFASVSSMD